jgi:hypothetical protein
MKWIAVYMIGHIYIISLKNISNNFIQNPETTSYNLRKETEMQQTTSFWYHPCNLLMRSMGSRDCMSPSAKIGRVGALRSDRRTYWRLLYAGHVDLTRAQLHQKPIANKNLSSPSTCLRSHVLLFGKQKQSLSATKRKWSEHGQTTKSSEESAPLIPSHDCLGYLANTIARMHGLVSNAVI